jgi:MbtH protein
MNEADETVYLVVVNHEEQYSIWQSGQAVPEGWRETGFSGTTEECLDHIERVWVDMRPLSLRQQMAQAATD